MSASPRQDSNHQSHHIMLEQLPSLITSTCTLLLVLEDFEGRTSQNILYFLRFARVIPSFPGTRFFGKLAPTLYACIYSVQADITSMGKSGAQVQSPVITLAKRRKYFVLCILKDFEMR